MDGWRPVLAVAVGTLLLTGCTSEPNDAAGGKTKGKASPSVSPPASSSAAPENEPYTLAEERAPKTREEAVAFVRGLAVRPDDFGIGYRKREPYESDPATWAVLHKDCLWEREALPKTVLSSLTRAFELPEKVGKGPVYLSLTVTVHEDDLAARRDMAGAQESALRCPEQQLNGTDVVRDLYSRVDAFADARHTISEDDLAESGQWTGDGTSKAHPFDWYKFRVGPVTVAATARHGAGRSTEEDSAITTDMVKGLSYVAAEIDRLGKAGGTGGTDEPADTAAGTPAGTEGAER
ncbi:hypothetical protein [Streptomyces pseudovenezuelae]|uniref:Outer membrane murein-binding lipoprotein Lpp n=1 Tax=Streptomyces pseudovenezuelae TaxID=67350 RepID=A0ABT6LAU6_9ACTN|nr:hypothetical protein [Streptomyces pseudovenezuelae]MDH6213438.1 outer membrane murein-binding lipoprotein Lpp [Streptomyces pseudovenezuelae]